MIPFNSLLYAQFKATQAPPDSAEKKEQPNRLIEFPSKIIIVPHRAPDVFFNKRSPGPRRESPSRPQSRMNNSGQLGGRVAPANRAYNRARGNYFDECVRMHAQRDSQ